MSQYTTGEMAKQCSVTVRTVQYYDKRGILTPSELTDGGRRLFSDSDVNRLKVICFLRELGLPINTISQLLSEEHPEKVIFLLLDQQEAVLRDEIRDRQEKLDKLESLRTGLQNISQLSLESIGDIAIIMENKKQLKKMHWTMVLTGIPISVLQLVSIYLWASKGIRWPFVLWAVIAIPFGILISKYYYSHTAYICPECHEIFRPTFKEMFWAPHTPATRKLTCTNCGHHGFCVETYREPENEKA